VKQYLIILVLAVSITFVGCQSGEPLLDYAEIIAELEAENERLTELLRDNGISPESERHPIDVSFAEALAIPENWATLGMLVVTAEHSDMWREEMEKYFELL